MRKTVINFAWTWLFLIITTDICAQITPERTCFQACLPKDSNMLINTSCPNPSLSFLLQEDSSYRFFINRIIPLEKGQLLECYTTWDNVYPPVLVDAYIVIPSKSNLYRYFKVGHSYYFTLNRYLEKPATTGIEISGVIDVLLGKQVLNIDKSGCFTYLYTITSCQKSKMGAKKVTCFTPLSENEMSAVTPMLHVFLKTISYSPEYSSIYGCVDTNNVKKNMQLYSENYYCVSETGYSVYPRRVVKKRIWGSEVLSDFSKLFSTMLDDYYRLPLREPNKDSAIVIKDIQLLYQIKHDYTIRIKWQTADTDKIYVAVVTISDKRGRYLITGFNKCMWYDIIP